MLAWIIKSLELFCLNNFNTFYISTFATIKYFIVFSISITKVEKWYSNNQTTKTLEGSSKIGSVSFLIAISILFFDSLFSFIILEWPIHHLQKFSNVKLTHPLPDEKAYVSFPLRENLRLDGVGRMQLLSFQIVYISL